MAGNQLSQLVGWLDPFWPFIHCWHSEQVTKASNYTLWLQPREYVLWWKMKENPKWEDLKENKLFG